MIHIIDIDECTMGTDDCGPETTATCMNTEGSYTCVCNEGYTGTMCTGKQITFSVIYIIILHPLPCWSS